MSWLPDPTKFLRRSYRKGDGDHHHEKMAKTSKDAAKSGGRSSSSKHSSLYSLMQASSNDLSLERSAEDDNPSLGGATESTTSNIDHGHLDAFTDSMDALPSQQSNHGDATELALIRHAANILLSNVPSSQAHAHHATKDGAAQIHASPAHGIKDPQVSHPTPDPSPSRVHETREPDLAEDEGTKEEEPLSATDAKPVDNVILEEQFISFAAPVNSENEYTDGSECKVISEDLAASRAPLDGKINSPSTSSNASENRKEKGNREHSKRKCPVGGGRKDPNSRNSSAPEKSRQPTSRQINSEKGEAKKASNRKKGPHAEKLDRENPKLEEERDQPMSPLNMPHQFFALQDSELGLAGPPARISVGQNVSHINSGKQSPILMAGRGSPLMQHQSFNSLQAGNELMEYKARTSAGHEAPKLNSGQRSPLMTEYREPTSPLMAGYREPKSPSTVPPYQAFSLQDSETVGVKERVSTSYNPTELFRRRSLLMTAQKGPNSPMMLHEEFSLQDHQVMRETTARRMSAASYNSVELGSRRQSPLTAAHCRDLPNFPSTPLHQISSPTQEYCEMRTGERARARASINYEALQLLGSRRSESPLVMTRRESRSPLPASHHNHSLRDHEIINRERARISVGVDDGQEHGLRRQSSPIMGGRNTSNSPTLMQHHIFLQLPDTDQELRGRRSVGGDGDLGLCSSRPAPRSDQSKPRPRVSSERFHFQEDELRSVYDRPPSPFLASQASLLRERRGSAYGDERPTLPSPAASRRFFLQNYASKVGQSYEPNSPLRASQQYYILQEDQKASYKYKPVSPMYLSNHEILPHPAMLSHHGFCSQEDAERCYDDDTGSAGINRSSFYAYEGRQGGFVSRNSYSSPLVSQRRETLDMSMLSNEAYLMQESEEGRALYHEQLPVEISDEFIGLNDVFSDDDDHDGARREMQLIGEDTVAQLPNHYMRSTKMQGLAEEEEDGLELQVDIQEDEDLLPPLYAEVLSAENSINSSYSKKQRSNHAALSRSKAESMSMSPLSENSRKSYISMKHKISKERLLFSKAEALSSMQSPLSEANSSISSGKRMMKKLKEAQREIAMVRRARKGFEEMMVEMVGCTTAAAGEDDYAVQNLLDLEEFVGGYERLSASSGIFKGVVDHFFHELCCELLQPVSQEDDPVLSMALLRLDQICSSPL